MAPLQKFDCSESPISKTPSSGSLKDQCINRSRSGKVQRRFSAPDLTQLVPAPKSCVKSPSRSERRQSTPLSFASVEIREYPRILGDNPSVSSGPPISLSWLHNPGEETYTIDDYEDARLNDRRSKMEFRVPGDVRSEWLVGAGFSKTEMRNAIATIEAEKKKRSSTASSSAIQDKAEITAEIFKRRFGRMVGKREKSDVLYKQWVEQQSISSN